MGLKWRQMLKDQFEIFLPLKESIIHIIASLPPNIVIPGKVGEFLRVYWIREPVKIEKKIMIILFDKIWDVYSLMIFSMIASLFWYPYILSIELLISFSALIVTYFLFSRSEHIVKIIPFNFIKKRVQRSSFMKLSKGSFFKISLTGAFLWLVQLLQILCIFNYLKVEIPLELFFLAIPFSLFAGALPFSFLGIGPREAVLMFYLKDFLSLETVAALGALFSMRIVYFSLLGIPLFMYKISNTGLKNALLTKADSLEKA